MAFDWLQRLRRRFRASWLNSISGPLPEDLFRRLVNRERARSDRSRRPFSMVVVELFGINLASLRKVYGLVASCIRETDDIGWFGPEELGVLLPETERDGASQFSEKLRDVLDPAGCPATIRHYTYQPECDQPETCGQIACGGQCGNPQKHSSPVLLSNTLDENSDASSHPTAQELDQGLGRMFNAQIPWWKRGMDILGASAMLLILSPVLMAISVAIKLSSPGPVIFRQRRAGIGGRPFDFYKFRTMNLDAEHQKGELLHMNEASGPVFKMANDPRITPLGRLLRRSSLDELPQLWNVVKGEMSLVGPRPPTMDEIQKYQPWQRRRLELVGGLTCIWQVSGRSLIPFEEWMRMDLRYSRKVSLWNDLILLVRTLGAVLSRRGAR